MEEKQVQTIVYELQTLQYDVIELDPVPAGWEQNVKRKSGGKQLDNYIVFEARVQLMS